MISKIDTQLSKAENRLVFEIGPFDRIFRLAMNALTILGFPAITLSYTFQHLDTIKDDLFAEFMGHLVAFGFAYFMYDLVKKPTRLVRITGKNSNENATLARKAIKEMNWSISVEKTEYLIAESPNYQKQLTIIFDRQDILLSSLTLGRGEAGMTFHSRSADTFTEKFKSSITTKVTYEQLK